MGALGKMGEGGVVQPWISLSEIYIFFLEYNVGFLNVFSDALSARTPSKA